MATDKARISHNPARQYRAVVNKQGRVSLEADANENTHIINETTRHHALDFVGPCGTPDNGYQLTPVAGPDLEIQPGTMYLGGWRLELDDEIRYSAQPDWLDTAVDPLWRAPSAITGLSNALLFAREQELVATEDPALREVALGGPDTAGRMRLLQRVMLASTTNRTCAGAQKETNSFWNGLGLDYNPADAELRSRARLQVSLVNTAPPGSPCDPPAQSGYLGADNQLMRAQVISYNPNTRQGQLIWGYNNASTLYRCTVLDPVTLELATRPVSAEYAPRTGQAVQLLLAAADLGEGAYAAALTGHVATLTVPYQPDTRRVTLPAAMPAPYQASGRAQQPLFLRLWEAVVPFTLGTAAELSGTGLAVTITAVQNGPLHIGDYWSFAVRPSTPNAVYPERILAAPQPPNGPRQWSCSLAVVAAGTATAGAGGFQIVEDCRLPFDNLPELTARQPGTGGPTEPPPDDDDCCCITIGPSRAKELQSIIDQFGDIATASVKFEPGEYVLDEPLRIDRRHNGLLLEACTEAGVVIRPNPDALERFGFGMFILSTVRNVTIRGLTFAISACPIPDELQKNLQTADYGIDPEIGIETTAIGLYLRRVIGLTVEKCTFNFVTGTVSCIGAGVLNHEMVSALLINDSVFASAKGSEGGILTGVFALPIGTPSEEPPAVGTVDGFTLEGNRFGGLAYGVVVAADSRAASVRHNIVRGGHGGVVWFDMERDGTAYRTLNEPVGLPTDEGFDQTNEFVQAVLKDREIRVLLAYGPLLWPSDLPPKKENPTPKQIPLALELTGNDLDCRAIDNPDLESGVALLVWDLHAEPTSAVTVTANRMWSRSPIVPTVVLLSASHFNITGNVMNNDIRDPGTYADGTPGKARFALLVVPGGREPARFVKEGLINMFTATGNTMTGSSNLNRWVRAEWAQQLPKSLQMLATWNFFNTET